MIKWPPMTRWFLCATVIVAPILSGASPALGQGIPVPVPPPVDQPAYQPVAALINRGNQCSAEATLRRDELWKAQSMELPRFGGR
jgi:hypothetical protein